jgi:hypothetical protein
MRRSTLPLTFSRLSRRLLGAALSLALLAGAGEQAQLAWAQPTSFEGAALVPVLGQGDIVKARSQALSEALSRALEQAVAEVLPEARSRVYLVSGRARDYVTTYRVLQEGEVAGQFQIRVAAQLDLPRLQRDLGGAAPGSLPAAANPTTIYVCTTQALPAAQVALEALRAGLKESLPSVELAAAAQCKQSPDFTALPGALGLLILTPSSTPAESLRGPQPPQYGAQARAHLQLVRPGREPVPASGDAVGFGPEASAAETEAQRQATLTGLRLLLASIGPLVRSGAGVVVRVENLGSFRAYQQILRVLSALPGVSRVEPRRFYLPGRAVSGEDAQVQLLLQTSATVDSLAATLGRTPLSGLQLQVMPLGEGELRVLCAPEGALPNPAQPAESSEPPDADKQVSVP